MSQPISLQPVQVSALPIGSGGKSNSASQLNQINNSLAMMNAQQAADSHFDPSPPPHTTEQKVIQAFCSGPSTSIPTTLMVIGGLCIVYGLVAK